jgi:hypothetical protein
MSRLEETKLGNVSVRFSAVIRRSQVVEEPGDFRAFMGRSQMCRLLDVASQAKRWEMASILDPAAALTA